jgi:hypothetical protein
MSAFVATRQKLNGVTLVKAEKVVAQFDVAIVPFLDTPLVARMSPMKREAYTKDKVPLVGLGGT